ncbi:MAG: MepB family protein [Rickettsiaceae bacterium]|nr:MepB family protein [Rickettsiaceae bacterium]
MKVQSIMHIPSTIKGKKGLFRIAKKTPTKSGYFVTIWKRGADSIIAPYEEADAIDFVVVAVSDMKVTV